MTWRERIVDFFGLKKSIVALLFMVVLVGLGEKMAERFLPIYLLALGGGILSVGFLNGMDNLLSALYSFPGGYLSDRLGYKRALVVFNLIAMSGYLIVILFPHWLAVIIGSAFFLSWTAISLPATMSLVSRALPAGEADDGGVGPFPDPADPDGPGTGHRRRPDRDLRRQDRHPPRLRRRPPPGSRCRSSSSRR